MNTTIAQMSRARAPIFRIRKEEIDAFKATILTLHKKGLSPRAIGLAIEPHKDRTTILHHLRSMGVAPNLDVRNYAPRSHIRISADGMIPEGTRKARVFIRSIKVRKAIPQRAKVVKIRPGFCESCGGTLKSRIYGKSKDPKKCNWCITNKY